MDKFSGALVGERGDGSGDDASSAISSASVSELLVLSDGRLLSASLSASDGSVTWLAVASREAELARVVSQSQMASMLRDGARNAAYARAVERAVAAFARVAGRGPRVLDVGAGTGLLSMLAARAGAAHVTGVEQWGVMADVARRVVAANAPQLGACPVEVLAKRSFDVRVVEGGDMAARADVIISEILDSALLGEGVLASLRHAYADLMHPSPICVPARARLIGQLVSCPTLAAWGDTGALEARPGAPLSRCDLTPRGACRARPAAIPVHALRLAALPAGAAPVPLCAPFTLCALELSPEGVREDAPALAEPHLSRVAAAAPAGVAPATPADALLFWWELTLWEEPDGSGRIAYSTAAADAAQNWQDHWVQCVIPLPAPVAPARGGGSAPPPAAEEGASSSAEAAEADALGWTVAASVVGGMRVDAVVAGSREAAVWPTKRARALALRGGLTSREAPSLVLEPELCTCGVHRTATHERRWALAAGGWREAVVCGVDMALQRAAAAAAEAAVDGSEAPASPIRILCLGEGSLCGVAAASSAAAVGAPLHVVCVESTTQAGVQAVAVVEAAAAAATGPVQVSVAVVPPTESLRASLPEWLEEEEKEGEEEGEEEEEEEEEVEAAAVAEGGSGVQEGGMDAVARAVGEAVDAITVEEPPAATEEEGAAMTTEEGARPLPPFHAVVCEPHWDTMSSAPLWGAAHLWWRLRALACDPAFAPALRPSSGPPALSPLRARVSARALHFTHLAATHGEVGAVCGFSHAPFDELERGWHAHTYAYPCWQYEWAPLGEPAQVLELDYARTEVEPASVCGEARLALGREPGLRANAVMLFVDYEVAPGVWACTAPQLDAGSGRQLPSPWRQAVRFLPPAHEAAAARVGVRLDVGGSGSLVVGIELD